MESRKSDYKRIYLSYFVILLLMFFFVLISLHGYVLGDVCSKYVHMQAYSDAQTHLGNTH